MKQIDSTQLADTVCTRRGTHDLFNASVSFAVNVTAVVADILFLLFYINLQPL